MISLYDDQFYDWQSAGSRQSAALVLPLVSELLKPSSVLDVGCGVGTWLAEWLQLGVSDVMGVDGDHVDRSRLLVAPGQYRSADLERPLSLGRRFDLVQSLEVAEHLGRRYADQFVESLTRHGDCILFSAAIPRQGGVHHVNEQWQSYWSEKFGRLGFRHYDVVRRAIWDDDRIKVEYRQNVVVYARSLPIERPETVLDVVHPQLWSDRKPPPPTLRDLAADLIPTAVRTAKYYRARARERSAGSGASPEGRR